MLVPWLKNLEKVKVMSKYILAIETSCDETSIAILEGHKNLLSNIISSQIKSHKDYGGVVPEIASRLHVEQINIVLDQALTASKVKLSDLTAIAFTKGPGLIGALHVGLQAAKTLSLSLNIPLIEVHHIAAHIFANNFVKDITYPALALVVSGGHTEIVYMKQELSFEVVGRTKDDAIGEAFDKVARILKLGYPGGPAIDELAHKGKDTYQLPKPRINEDLNLSYSGLKTAVLNIVNNAAQKGEKIRVADMCASFQKTAVDMVLDKIQQAIKKYSVKTVVLAGGVAANSYLRDSLPKIVASIDKNIVTTIPPLWSCTDNAAMIAILGSKLYDLKKFSDLGAGVDPNWDISFVK
jgi:N6-L-threonylcarbamoyladenine synthase